MGLDMYLTKRVYVGANYAHNEVRGVIELATRGKPLKVELAKIESITESVGYWRKANQIHAWLVDNVQGGKDDCGEYRVDHSLLGELKELCRRVIATKDTSLLPPRGGFFFGSTDPNSLDYMEDIHATLDILEKLDLDDRSVDYYYRSSW